MLSSGFVVIWKADVTPKSLKQLVSKVPARPQSCATPVCVWVWRNVLVYIHCTACSDMTAGANFNQDIDLAGDLDFQKLASLMDGYSGDDITNVCRDAAMNGMRRKIAGKTPEQIRALSKEDMHEPVTMDDFMQVRRKLLRGIDFSTQLD